MLDCQTAVHKLLDFHLNLAKNCPREALREGGGWSHHFKVQAHTQSWNTAYHVTLLVHLRVRHLHRQFSEPGLTDLHTVVRILL